MLRKMKLGKYSFGIGDRFGHQGEAQLKAIIKAKESGVDITPVWNKSFREHQIIQSKPENTREEADLAVKSHNWQKNYFVDADQKIRTYFEQQLKKGIEYTQGIRSFEYF